jgi:HSP20 family molecular chaperone IbpA
MALKDLTKINGSTSKTSGVDIERGPHTVDIKVELPGYKPTDVFFEDIGDGFICITANNGVKEDVFNVLVGPDTDFSSANARLKNGVLNISFAKVKARKAKIVIS